MEREDNTAPDEGTAGCDQDVPVSHNVTGDENQMSVTSADDIELQCSADINGNIAPDEQPEKENAINIKSIVKETPSYVCHVKLMTQAKELTHALNKALGLEQNGISHEHTSEFVKLMEKYGQELMDTGEYIIDTSVKLSDAHDRNLQNQTKAQFSE